MLVPQFPSKRRKSESNEIKLNVTRRGMEEQKFILQIIWLATHFFFGLSRLIDWSNLAPMLQYSASEKEQKLLQMLYTDRNNPQAYVVRHCFTRASEIRANMPIFPLFTKSVLEIGRQSWHFVGFSTAYSFLHCIVQLVIFKFSLLCRQCPDYSSENGNLLNTFINAFTHD